jgi:hypothetical protein
MVRRPASYGLITEPGKRDIEKDTLMCCHCGQHIEVKPGPTGHYEVPRCTCCDDWRCYKPECEVCRPLEERLRLMEWYGRKNTWT